MGFYWKPGTKGIKTISSGDVFWLLFLYTRNYKIKIVKTYLKILLKNGSNLHPCPEIFSIKAVLRNFTKLSKIIIITIIIITKTILIT